ncbi:hypothetical protein F3Y22_tig00003518pilonHSYRG00014 [Hibiscus syriacus]|uniref:Uncharacterized protein n=1 Tax=Hibiscus syriacus TaxID=106335 RepID=A0A6A3CM13_HIBSY|nr:hypothetical protein F3Y22_tig00003518pilonHSYRG00014 [Hibiscus syriacus]
MLNYQVGSASTTFTGRRSTRRLMFETSPIADLSEICHTMPQYTCVDGDGTVPAESAMADGFAAVERVGVPSSHRGLLHDQTVFKLIQKWLGVEQKVKKHPKTSKVVDASSN